VADPTGTAEVLLPRLTAPQEVAILARALARQGYGDLLGGHITVRADDGTLLCTPWPLLWSEVRPADVIRIDLEGNLVAGDWQVPPGIPLHLQLHAARDDVVVAVHNHSRYGTLWASAGQVPPIHDQTGGYHWGAVALVDEYGGPVDDSGRARSAVDAMEGADVALLANHGVFVLGSTVPQAFLRAVALEHRCRLAWELRAIEAGVVVPQSVVDAVGARRGPEWVLAGFWEAAARAELRADPTVLE
jgi:ribulose-5-phosphate 4-epimerase/fuculose-1-phosphate aldolase